MVWMEGGDVERETAVVVLEELVDKVRKRVQGSLRTTLAINLSQVLVSRRHGGATTKVLPRSALLEQYQSARNSHLLLQPLTSNQLSYAPGNSCEQPWLLLTYRPTPTPPPHSPAQPR